VTSVQSALVADCGVAVLGGTAGVGLETASQFAEQGARVVLLGRNHERGAAVCHKIHLRAPLGDPPFVRVDATDPDDTVRAEQECRSVLGSIDVLVNTTGPCDHPRLLHTIPIQFVHQRINEIILPPLHMMHAALPAMRGNGSGSIINVAIGVEQRASIASRGCFALKAHPTTQHLFTDADLGPDMSHRSAGLDHQAGSLLPELRGVLPTLA
jgi:NAD(P)-dependent dehydrogenase (short-subunit alcohol dehydrogenase family)